MQPANREGDGLDRPCEHTPAAQDETAPLAQSRTTCQQESLNIDAAACQRDAQNAFGPRQWSESRPCNLCCAKPTPPNPSIEVEESTVFSSFEFASNGSTATSRSEAIPRTLTASDDPRSAASASSEASLDKRTQLVEQTEPNHGWFATIYPECSEASLVWQSPKSLTSNHQQKRQHLWLTGVPRLPTDALSVELRQAEEDLNWKIANGRAASRSRRYFVRNHLRYMWVLTFAESVRQRHEVMALVAAFARRLRGLFGGQPFPYWYSPELHPGGHGWHVNFFIATRVKIVDLERLWGQGFVWVTDFAISKRGPKGEALGLCQNEREGTRRAARYGCKYAQKDWSRATISTSSHRYEIAQGFKPQMSKQRFASEVEAMRAIVAAIPNDDKALLTYWSSDTAEDWNRPPVRTFQW